MRRGRVVFAVAVVAFVLGGGSASAHVPLQAGDFGVGVDVEACNAVTCQEPTTPGFGSDTVGTTDGLRCDSEPIDLRDALGVGPFAQAGACLPSGGTWQLSADASSSGGGSIENEGLVFDDLYYDTYTVNPGTSGLAPGTIVPLYLHVEGTETFTGTPGADAGLDFSYTCFKLAHCSGGRNVFFTDARRANLDGTRHINTTVLVERNFFTVGDQLVLVPNATVQAFSGGTLGDGLRTAHFDGAFSVCSTVPGVEVDSAAGAVAPASACRSLSGRVGDTSGNPVVGAPVQACPVGGGAADCATAQTDSNGNYAILGLPDGTYDVTAFPPDESNLAPATRTLTLSGGLSVTGFDFVLATLPPQPQILLYGKQSVVMLIGIPVQLTVPNECTGGTGTFAVVQGSASLHGSLTEGPPGTYGAVFTLTDPPFTHDAAEIDVTIHCPDGSTSTLSVSSFIDPSGVVRDTHGHAVAGATVTLLRSDTGAPGTFTQVPDGSDLMAPTNRHNPDATNAFGGFGWDVRAGFYEVQAQKDGCTAPGDPSQDVVTSPVLPIPPEITDLVLTLDCGGAAPPPDTTPPTITCGSADGHWHNADVSIACTASDAESGLANAGDASFTLSTHVPAGTETANAQTDSLQVCDVAGNCATAGPIGGNEIDEKPPTVTTSAPAAGAVYLLHQQVAASYSCSDGGSGVASCSGPVASGAPVSTAVIGSASFTVTGTDAVGNSAKQTTTYTVAYRICALFDAGQSRQSGSTLPVKLELCDANGVDVSSPALAVRALSVDAGPASASGNANPGGLFRYDATLGPGGGYIYNLSLKGLAPGTHTLNLGIGGDPTAHSLTFVVR